MKDVMPQDPVSPKLREVEKEVDSLYKQNALLQLRFVPAVWYLLSVAEDNAIVRRLTREAPSLHQTAALADNLLFELNYPLNWLHSSCEAGGEIQFQNNERYYRASAELLGLGSHYRHFVTAYTFASRGLIDLDLKGSTVIPNLDFSSGSEYEAYNRLIKPHAVELNSKTAIRDLHEAVAKVTKIDNERFTYQLTPKLVNKAQRAILPLLYEQFVLPDNWSFSRYSLAEFRQVFQALGAMAFIHWIARVNAGNQGIPGRGFVDGIRLMKNVELTNRVKRYSGVDELIVKEILSDLTYGNKAIRNPDPATQPLIRFDATTYGISPSIWITNSLERNLTVLLNKLPDDKVIYSRLVNEKENSMRTQIQDSLSDLGLRFVNAALPPESRLPNIDLAIISDAQQACLLLELKWFIDPADVSEVVSRSEDLRKGVDQLHQLEQAYREGYPPLLDTLAIDASYSLLPAVASANWIGRFDVQDARVLIVKAEHLVRKLVSSRNVLDAMDWLKERKYLPIRGQHYEVKPLQATVGKWSVEWYGLKPLMEDEFFPL